MLNPQKKMTTTFGSYLDRKWWMIIGNAINPQKIFWGTRLDEDLHPSWMGCNVTFPMVLILPLGGRRSINGVCNNPVTYHCSYCQAIFSLCPKMKQSTLIVSFQLGGGVKNTLSGQPGLDPQQVGTTQPMYSKHSLVPSTSPFLGLTTTYNFLGSEAQVGKSILTTTTHKHANM